MTDWTAPATDTWHVEAGVPHLAGRVPPGRCDDRCSGLGRMVWAERDAVIKLDDDPGTDPARFGTAGGAAGDH